MEKKPLHEMMVSFVGEENARVYTLTNEDHARIKKAMLDDEPMPWVSFKPYGQRHAVYVNMALVKRIIF